MFFFILRNYSNSKIQNNLLKIQNKELTTVLKTSETNSPRQKKKLPDGKDKKRNKISKWLELTAFNHLRFLVCSMPITCKSSK